MLELRPSCEHCDVDLAPDAPGAFICTYECTFCEPCATDVLSLVCPNCTGWLVPRPPRPTERLGRHPDAVDRVHQPADLDAHPAKVATRVAGSPRQVHLQEIVVDCGDPVALAAFYGAVLDVPVVVRSPAWAWVEPRTTNPAAGRLRIAFQQVPEPKVGKVRLHLDLGTWDLASTRERVLAAGGRVLGEVHLDDDGHFQVFADPEGHELCLVDA